MLPKIFASQLNSWRFAIATALICTFISFIYPMTASAKDYTYKINPSPDSPVQGDVTWFPEVFATGGATTKGVTIRPDPNDSTRVTANVDDSIVGDVILHAYYTTPDGRLVALKPITVVSIHPASAQNGIELQPSPAIIIAGEHV